MAGDNNFFAKIQSGFSSGLERIGTDVLPNWAANQIKTESKDQLAQPTFDKTGANAPQRLDNLLAVPGVPGGVPKVAVFGALGLLAVGGLFLALRK